MQPVTFPSAGIASSSSHLPIPVPQALAPAVTARAVLAAGRAREGVPGAACSRTAPVDSGHPGQMQSRVQGWLSECSVNGVDPNFTAHS